MGKQQDIFSDRMKNSDRVGAKQEEEYFLTCISAL